MSTITKERAKDILEFGAARIISPITDDEIMELARIALASLEAEPVAWLWSNRKHPSEVTLVRPEDDEKAEPGLWSGWSCQALYADPLAPVSVPDERAAFNAWNNDTDCPLAGRDAKTAAWLAWSRRAAMLQGADGNSPVIPDGWVIVPVEPTAEMQSAAAGAIRFDTTPINKLWTGNAVYRAMIAAAPQQEVKS